MLLLLTLRAQSVDFQCVRLGNVSGLFRNFASPFLDPSTRYLTRAVALAADKVVVMMIGFTLAVLLGVWIVVSQYLALAPGLA